MRDLKTERWKDGSKKSRLSKLCFQIALANLRLFDACNSSVNISVNRITMDKFNVRQISRNIRRLLR